MIDRHCFDWERSSDLFSLPEGLRQDVMAELAGSGSKKQ
jgi:hypothetical protein